MKFTRRPDLDPHTRIEMVRRAWLYQGVYGKMTQIAYYYQISRTFLYQLIFPGQPPVGDAVQRCKAPVAKRSSAFRATALVVTLGRKLRASEYVVDLESSGIPPQFCRLSQSVLPKRGADASVHPLDAVNDMGVLSQR